ncbi:MAG TPA: BPSS1780 family membrane protein [Usitatibacter sp.]|nr:BPSS1780 family membrane protein [Usitatibacter sp.]
MSTTAEAKALDAGLALVVPGRREAAGAGWTWVVQGWRLFMAAPLMWVIAVVIMFVLAIVVNILPFVGSLIFQVLQAVFMGGFVAACRSLETGGEFELEQLFAGFSKRFVPLAIVGGLLLVGWIIIALVFAGVVGFSMLGAFMTGDPAAVAESMAASIGLILLATLLMLALMVPLLAAYWFAPALVMIHDMKPAAAMKESFFACFRNFVPFAVYGLVMFVTLIIAMVPFGLGLLVWVPLAITSTYAAYRRIFTDEAAVAPVAVPPSMAG